MLTLLTLAQRGEAKALDRALRELTDEDPRPRRL
jgi:hypothetical protein